MMSGAASSNRRLACTWAGAPGRAAARRSRLRASSRWPDWAKESAQLLRTVGLFGAAVSACRCQDWARP